MNAESGWKLILNKENNTNNSYPIDSEKMVFREINRLMIKLNPSIELEAIDYSVIRESGLSSDNKDTFEIYGFLGWVAPHLYFGEFEDEQIFPTLNMWSWLSDWKTDTERALSKYGEFIVIGSGPDEQPIVTKRNENQVYLILNSLELKLLNSSVIKLIHVASAFLDMVDKATELTPETLIEKSIPTNLIDEFLHQLSLVEHDNLGNCIWREWAIEIGANRNIEL